MLIKLSDGCWVEADEVAEVKINDFADHITVRMKDGIGHSLGWDYGRSIYQTLDRLVTEINNAKTKEK